jgi:hypothetical protein
MKQGARHSRYLIIPLIKQTTMKTGRPAESHLEIFREKINDRENVSFDLPVRNMDLFSHLTLLGQDLKGTWKKEPSYTAGGNVN